MQFAHPCDNLREEECTRGRKPGTSGQSKIAKPSCWHARFAAAKLSAVKGLHREDGIHNALLSERIERFCNKATGGIVVF
jgi:hypothetical protein